MEKERFTPRARTKRVRGFGYEREPSPAAGDEVLGWRVLPMSQSGQEQELEWRVLPMSQHLPRREQDKENSMPQKAKAEDALALKLDVASLVSATPRSSSSVDVREPSLSMAPQSIRPRRDASPRSMTPRSFAGRDAPSRQITPQGTPRGSATDAQGLKHSASAPRLESSSRDAACQVTPMGSLMAAQGDATPRSTTPRAVPQSVTPRGNVTPRSMTPRGATPRGEAALSMTPQLITRRDASPRNVTPRGSASGGSARGMRSCASEALFRCGS